MNLDIKLCNDNILSKSWLVFSMHNTDDKYNKQIFLKINYIKIKNFNI